MFFNKAQTTISTVSVVETEVKQEDNAMYFPPPPTYAASTSAKPIRVSKPPPPEPVAATVSAKRARRSSTHRQYIGFSSQPRRRRLQEAHLPAIKLSPRHWILVTLLLLSFLVLVLGFIFADCVALPHTDRQDGAASEDIDFSNVTLFGRRQINTNTNPTSDPRQNPYLSPTDKPQEVDLNALNRTGQVDPAGAGGLTAPPNGTAPSEVLNSERKRMGFDSPKNLALLFFYTATLPLMTIIHTIAELVVLWCAKKRSSSSSLRSIADNDSDSDKDSITNLKTLSLAKKHQLSNSNSGKLHAILGFLPAISLTASVLIICGWIVINAIQLHCEIPIPSVRAAGVGSSAQAICPVQIRGHYMQGIHELSIVRNVFSWILVAVYIGYAAWCVRINGLVWKAAKEQRKARKSRVDLEGKREDQLRRNIVRFSIRRKEEVSRVDPEKAKVEAKKVDAMVAYLGHA